jgi:hypothetical protein
MVNFSLALIVPSVQDGNGQGEEKGGLDDLVPHQCLKQLTTALRENVGGKHSAFLSNTLWTFSSSAVLSDFC